MLIEIQNRFGYKLVSYQNNERVLFNKEEQCQALKRSIPKGVKNWFCLRDGFLLQSEYFRVPPGEVVECMAAEYDVYPHEKSKIMLEIKPSELRVEWHEKRLRMVLYVEPDVLKLHLCSKPTTILRILCGLCGWKHNYCDDPVLKK